LIGPERSDINQLNSLLSTPLQSSILTELAIDLDQGSGWTTRFRLRIQTALSGSLLVFGNARRFTEERFSGSEALRLTPATVTTRRAGAQASNLRRRFPSCVKEGKQQSVHLTSAA